MLGVTDLADSAGTGMANPAGAVVTVAGGPDYGADQANPIGRADGEARALEQGFLPVRQRQILNDEEAHGGRAF